VQQSAYHGVEVRVEEPPTSGSGRPRQTPPRVGTAGRYGLQATRHPRAEVLAHKVQELGCFVLLTKVPPAGERAHRAGEVRRADQAQHGGEQHCACLQAPGMVNSGFVKKPERIEALGVVLFWALLLWRLVERALRLHVETPGSTVTGGTRRPPRSRLPA
jgi:hypothetical protein